MSVLLQKFETPFNTAPFSKIKNEDYLPAFKEAIGLAKAEIDVMPLEALLDPQGKAIHHAIEGLGFSGVHDVRAGRLIEIEHEPGVSKADLETMCTKLLANMVIENFEIEQA